MNALDRAAVLAGDAARTAAWEAFLADVPMTWLALSQTH